MLEDFKNSRLINDEELPGFCLEQHFSLGSIFLSEGKENLIATCDLLVREAVHRNFLLAGGLEAIIKFLKDLRYDEQLIDCLLKMERISEKFAKYLKNFSFSCDVDAMPEGTVHFPGEPMLRITGPIIEVTLVTDILISLANIDTMLLSKLARVRIAAKDIQCSIGAVRAQGIDAGWRASRNSIFFRKMAFSSITSSSKLGLGAMASVLNANHAFIKSFDSELEALRAAARNFPDAISPMVDTYDIKQGLTNLITVADELNKKGKEVASILIDSGDLLEISKYARKRLDEAGHPKIKIAVASNLDEYKAAKFLEAGMPVDIFVMVTDVITSADSPKMETVYKLAQIEDGNNIRYTAKFSPGKLSLPGKKQVYRKIENGLIVKDTIGLEGENDLGQPLLVPIFRKGKLVYNVPTQEENREYVEKQLSQLPEKYREIFKDYESPLEISPKINEILETVRSQHISHNL